MSGERARLRETVAWSALGALLIAGSAQPAFEAYFFGEAFLYLGQYWGADGRFWQALATPSDVVFFKPVCFVASLPWYFLLPADPFAYHLRNFAFTVANVVLLHRVLLRLVASPTARGLALLLFSGSKVHLTTIGYLMIFDSIVMLGLLLAAVLATLRWRATRARRDYVAALLCCALCAFTKDYGIAVVAVVLAAAAPAVLDETPAARVRVAAAWIVPLALVAAARVVMRQLVVGTLPWWHPVYAPAFSMSELGRKAVLLLTTFGNTAVAWHDRTGASGIGLVVSALVPRSIADAVAVGPIGAAEWIDGIFALAVAGALVTAVVRAGRRRAVDLLLPFAWSAAFFAPPLLTRNFQIYYVYEPIAGLAVLAGVALADADRRTLRRWAALVAIVAASGVVSNHAALYDWQFAARQAATAADSVVAAHRGSAIRSLSIVTSDVPFWRWTLTADGKAPMLPFLLARPALPVRIFDRSVLAEAARDLPAGHLAVDADSGFAPVNRSR